MKNNAHIITCPDVLEQEHGRCSIFLAGGISNCSDWQQTAISRIVQLDLPIIAVNPRRFDFDITNPKMSEEQIDWEHAHLARTNAILFWFPWETLCPITLYELGVAAASGRKIFVGVDPEYQRKFDVKHQLSLIRPDVYVNETFDDLMMDVELWIRSVQWTVADIEKQG